MATALVTGATAGIGLSFARQLAGHGHDLVLVARTAERLEELAERIRRQFHVEVEVIVADLSDLDGCRLVEHRLADPDAAPVEWLVNNAGFGVSAPFAHSDVDAEQAMLDVLVTAPMRLTHAALPGMLGRGRGRIVVVSSVASFLPGGSYSAAKAWATVFAESLSAQYRAKGVHVSALCPGYTHTEFHQRAEMDVSGIPRWLWLDADAVAEAGLRGCEQGRAVVVPGGVYKGIHGLTALLPRPLVRRIAGRS
ncbi:MAG: SDR family oxidoreductase [Actinobacteria bacterium]|nr:SDR family oxidoreductase [Actinomycetota bacterium]MCB9411755.1 SDR family oxidoreductase [Actinomycetota bacterium]